MSKVLEAFRVMVKDNNLSDCYPNTILTIEEELKALEIIKKNLNLEEILLAVKGSCKASDYDLLKEVLKYGK